MIVDITQIPLSNIRPNSVLVFRAPGDIHRHAEEFLGALKQANITGARVLLIRDDTSLQLLPEHEMNAAGWYRKTDL